MCCSLATVAKETNSNPLVVMNIFMVSVRVDEADSKYGGVKTFFNLKV